MSLEEGGEEKRRKSRELDKVESAELGSYTQSSLLNFYLSYSLAPNEKIWSLSPRMSFFIVQSQVIQSNTPLNECFRPFWQKESTFTAC